MTLASFLSWAMPVMSCCSMSEFLDFVVADDQRAGLVLERGEDLQRHVVAHGEPDRAGLQHLGADRGELEHFLIGDALSLRARGTMRGSVV